MNLVKDLSPTFSAELNDDFCYIFVTLLCDKFSELQIPMTKIVTQFVTNSLKHFFTALAAPPSPRPIPGVCQTTILYHFLFFGTLPEKRKMHSSIKSAKESDKKSKKLKETQTKSKCP